MLQCIAVCNWLLPRVEVHTRRCHWASGTHGSLSFDPDTQNMVKLLTKSAIVRNKHLPHSMFIYDNFNMDFKVTQPTTGKTGSHTSMTSATFAPYAEGLMSEDLKFTRELHVTSWFNKDNAPGSPVVYTPCIWDVMPWPEGLVDGLDSLHWAFTWHLWAILIQQDQSFGKYRQHLGLPDAIDPLPVTKTLQFPASTINMDESSHDGNWEVFKSLLEQFATPDEQLEDEIILIHSDLATKEKIDGLHKMCTIEKSAKNHLSFAVIVPGLFHLKMAMMDALWRTHIQPAKGWDDQNGFYEYIYSLLVSKWNNKISGCTWVSPPTWYHPSHDMDWCP